MLIAEISQVVQTRYGKFAQAAGVSAACCGEPPASACCAVEQGTYAKADLDRLPELARKLSRGCGNPTGFANLLPGEAVVDFGCGGGIDVILAAQKVGERGKVYGIDMTPQMIERAGEAVAQAGLRGACIELRRATLEDSTLGDACADVLISNCVINLCPDKEAVYREAFRVLKPGGRLAVSDILLTDPLEAELRERFRAGWFGCMGGAIPEDDYWRTLTKAGFVDLQVVARHPLAGQELAEMSGCPGAGFAPPAPAADLQRVQGKVESVKFTAVKPAQAGRTAAVTADMASKSESGRQEAPVAAKRSASDSGSALLVGGILAAAWASICCGVPLVLLTLGISGAWISTLTAFAPLRPVFIVLALILVGLAVRRAFFSPVACVAGTACADPRVRRKRTASFVSLSVVFVAIFAFPWYAPLFIGE